ncbi:Bromodomain testis-specific protein, partial [Fasciolopsis buskii]
DIRAKASIQATLGSGTAEDELAECGLSRRRSSNRLFASGDLRQLTPVRSIMEELEHTIQPGGGGVTASLIAGTNDPSASVSGSISQSLISATSSEERVAILVARLSLWRVRRQEEALLSSWSTWWIEQNGPAGQEITDRTPEVLLLFRFQALHYTFSVFVCLIG